MRRNHLKGLDKAKLRRWLWLFFLSLALPTTVLIQQSYSRLKWEAFHQHQLMAEELAARINRQFLQLINREEQRPVTDYSFLNVAGVPAANFLQRSPLSAFPVNSELPGLIGYFQVDAAGKLLTPFIPESIEQAKNYGIAEQELTARVELQNRIQHILSDNRLVKNESLGKIGQDKVVKGKVYTRSDAGLVVSEKDTKSSVEYSDSISRESEAASKPVEGQTAFDELRKAMPRKSLAENKLGRVEDLALTKNAESEPTKQKPDLAKEERAASISKKRMEQSILPEAPQRAKETVVAPSLQEKNLPAAASPAQPAAKDLRIRTFESALDPFEFSQLNSGHFVLFRKVWLNNQRYIQGLLIDQDVFLKGMVNTAFQETRLAQMSDLQVAFQGNVLTAFSGKVSRGTISSAKDFNGELLYQTQLSDPLSDLLLIFSLTNLPIGSGGWVIIWLTLVLITVFIAGFYFLYRLGVSQINLVNQQQDFISAVSHELKTPLTSIRMYGEMLQAGWVDEVKKLTYYDFILDESERLTRLINNVLQLAKMTRNEKQPEFKLLTVAELMDSIQSKVSSQIERAGFELHLIHNNNTEQAKINVNADWFIQIMINLVDNAIKFSAKADKKTIDLSCHRLSNGQIQFKVRDYGTGVAKDQMKKIFKLFYRSENELTRETVGTGIGLALTYQMVVSMKGRIDVVNSSPGAEFRVVFSSN